MKNSKGQMNSLNFEQAREYAEKQLEGELSPHLVYHGIANTREEISALFKVLQKPA
jgi:hypothetical protein